MFIKGHKEAFKLVNAKIVRECVKCGASEGVTHDGADCVGCGAATSTNGICVCPAGQIFIDRNLDGTLKDPGVCQGQG